MSLQVYLYPENEETQSMFVRVAQSLSLPLTMSVHDKEGGKPVKKVVGHNMDLNKALSHR